MEYVPNEAEPGGEREETLDYRGKESGEALPAWLEAYLEEGAAGLEALPEYQDYYAFIAENAGAPEFMEQWFRRFDVNRAFPRVSALRFRFRFIRGIDRNVDEVYGKNYESAVKAAFNTRFPEAWKKDDFWLVEKNGDSGLPRRRYFILMLVSKTVYEERIYKLIGGISEAGSSKEQNAAFSRLRDAFFEGF